MEFHQLNIDDRLLKSVSQLGWERPTLIQEKCIPLVLEGKDVLVRAKTGSGKTASYALPLIQKVLEAKVGDVEPTITAAVLVPSKELCYQVTQNIRELCSCLSDIVSVANLSVTDLRSSAISRLDIVVATPSRLLSHLQSKSLKILVLDEADLMFSFGYEEDIKAITSFLPLVCQTVLMSATLSTDVLSLKKLILNNPVIVKLEEPVVADDRLVQYYIRCSKDDKYLLMYTLLKLKLIRGKTLVFVNEINSCYRLKLFLEQFFIATCVLNSELPQNSRYHTVEQFNAGVYDYIIATDEVSSKNEATSKKRKKRKCDEDYSVSRGIDFQSVDNVINFDFPPSVNNYIHRIGRTARGFEYGTALTLVDDKEEILLERLQEELQNGDLLAETVKPYNFKMSEIEGFRYRVQDAIRNVSAVAIREARLKEIRQEIVASEKLKTHFKENPRDLQVLKHNKALLPKRTQNHLRHIPSYLVPRVMIKESTATYIRQRTSKGRIRKLKRNDPLKSFTMSSQQTK